MGALGERQCSSMMKTRTHISDLCSVRALKPHASQVGGNRGRQALRPAAHGWAGLLECRQERRALGSTWMWTHRQAGFCTTAGSF